MTKLPVLKPKDVISVLKRLGFGIRRQTGSHVRLVHPDGRATTVTLHKRDLPRGTLKAILRQSEISLKEFIKNL